MDIPVGKVTHYYDKIGVAVVEVGEQPLRMGDTVKFSGHDQEFTQKISSMQIEHAQIPEAKTKESVGIQVDKPVKVGDRVYLMSTRQ